MKNNKLFRCVKLGYKNGALVSRCLGTAAEREKKVTSPKPMSEMPGPKGLPVIGSLWDYSKKDGFRFNKMFLVCKMLNFFALLRYLYMFYRYIRSICSG